MTYVEKAVANYTDKRKKFYKGQLDRDLLGFNKVMTHMQEGGTCIGCVVQCVDCPVRMYIQDGHKELACGTLTPTERAIIIKKEVDEPEQNMSAQGIHRYIWQYVIDHWGTTSLSNLKDEARRELLVEGRISAKAGVYLEVHQSCVLCMLYGNACSLCPLKACATPNTAFHKAVQGDKEAMEYIRDIDVLENMKAVNKSRLEILEEV